MEDLTKLTLRELLVLARERLGSAASRLKTRDELRAALSGEAPPPPEPEPTRPQVQVVTRDFFLRRT